MSVAVKTAVFTAIETIAIAGWRALLTAGRVIAGAFLAGGLLLEHIVSYNYRNGRSALKVTGLPFAALAGIAGFEAIVWAAWFALTFVNPILAAVVLYVGLLVGHAPELNVMRGFSPFYRFFNRLKRSFDITAIETGTGITWLALAQVGYSPIAIIILFVGLYVEHRISGRKVL